jgi:uncharacterized protein DUF3667
MPSAAPVQPASPPLDATTRAPSWDTQCLNCGASLTAAFCGECGQRAVPAHPTLRELFGEAFAEFSGWDGKFAETIRTLVRRPGQLTIEFLAGRRARFISPLRLYLTASVLYFLLAESAPSSGSYIGLRNAPASGISVQSSEAKLGGLTAQERADILSQLEASPKWLRPLAKRAAEDPKRLQADVFQAMPKGLFALLPVFALLLAIFYRGRRFADHLYFAIHVHAFVFIALILNDLTRFAHLQWLSLLSGITVLLWLPLYGHFALRRVYGGSQTATLLKELGIGTLYALASVPMWFMIALWVASRPV